MSLLQDILDKMYIDPELLEQLDEDQKQTLFIKMREEQIRRWKAFDEQQELFEKENPKPKSKKRRIDWMQDRNGEVWVWVMGEHSDDKPIEELIEEDLKRKAREIAETEVLAASLKMDDSMNENSLDEQYLKKQLAEQFSDFAIGTGGDYRERPGSSNGMNSSLSLYDDAFHPESVHKPSSSYSNHYFSNNYDAKPASEPKPNNKPTSNGNGSIDHNIPIATAPPQVPKKPVSVVPPPIPSRPAFLQKKPEKPKDDYVKQVRSYVPGKEPVVSSSPSPFPPADYPDSRPRPIYESHPTDEINGNDTLVRLRVQNRTHLPVATDVEKRQSEIYDRLIEERDRLKREAELEEDRRRKEFEEQEKKAREAEAQIRVIAQRARQQYEKNLRTSESLLPALNESKATSLKEAIKLVRPPKPDNRAAIIQWYIKTEIPRGTGFDPKTNLPARWFHGIISRAAAEELLNDKPAGAFLVRVSERIWGYTISYVIGNGESKHFLVETIPEGYQFLGTNQVVHKSLYDLILYHETAPITPKGKEILRMPVGQSSNTPDYADLIDLSSLQRSSFQTNFFRRL